MLFFQFVLNYSILMTFTANIKFYCKCFSENWIFFCIEPVILGPHLTVSCSGIWNFICFYLIHFWVMNILNYGLNEKNYPLWSWPCCSLITSYRTHSRWHLCYDVDQITESWCVAVHLGPFLRLRVNKYSLNIFCLACVANSLNPGWDIVLFIWVSSDKSLCKKANFI